MRVVRQVDLLGLSRDPGFLVSGKNGGYQAIGLAVHLGATRMLLSAFDMQPEDHAQIHWHGSHQQPLTNPRPDHFEDWIRRFASMVRDLAELGIEVVNCSRRTALECFPRVRLEDVL